MPKLKIPGKYQAEVNFPARISQRLLGNPPTQAPSLELKTGKRKDKIDRVGKKT